MCFKSLFSPGPFKPTYAFFLPLCRRHCFSVIYSDAPIKREKWALSVIYELARSAFQNLSFLLILLSSPSIIRITFTKSTHNFHPFFSLSFAPQPKPFTSNSFESILENWYWAHKLDAHWQELSDESGHPSTYYACMYSEQAPVASLRNWFFFRKRSRHSSTL